MTHYGRDYFDWQRNMGSFGAEANLFLFDPHVKPHHRLIDFGSGGGYLLERLRCAEKIGVELNPVAREHAQERGISTVGSSDEIPHGWADVVISSHALEHTHSPLDEIRKLRDKLKTGGLAVFVVPCERKNPWAPGDIHQHLFTWSEMNLGNLFTLAGYHVVDVREVVHKWPPRYYTLRKYLGAHVFHRICQLYGWLTPRLTQIKVIASKEDSPMNTSDDEPRGEVGG
jgi:SAM-dependent methyltransferase